jgi:hypothetical protein
MRCISIKSNILSKVYVGYKARQLQTVYTYSMVLNGGEKRLGQYYVDSFCEETNVIYEMLECWYHGCFKCYPNRDLINPFSMESMASLYRKTFQRFDEIKRYGLAINYIWECDFDASCKHDPQYKSLIDQFYPNLEPIEPREALFGGRTYAVQLYYEVDERTQQEIRYADICSLYPYVCKYKAYTLGHTVILSKEDIEIALTKDSLNVECYPT